MPLSSCEEEFITLSVPNYFRSAVDTQSTDRSRSGLDKTYSISTQINEDKVLFTLLIKIRVKTN